MQMKTGDTLHGFTVTRVREHEELGGRLVEMVYEKTGTELVWVDNGIENKLFSIAFKTLPEDSTGVFHILEHSVLCGSEKYPVREPFVELLKSSMNTFLNAMTFSDKTMYPVSSRNARDYLNLTEVYLDAVFAPNILRDPNIFYQEGWHIEQGEDGTLSYKGVVFNEMKGAMSSPDSLAEYKMNELMFPQTSYGFNSGGDPAVIPTLTYEQFLETYHRFYHPSNAKIFLDGSVPLDETLALIESYLSRYEKRSDFPEVKMQTPVSASAQIEYDLAEDESPENQTYYAVGRIACTWQDRAKALAIRVLNHYLAGTNESPLKRAVLNAGLASDLDTMLDDSLPQNMLMLLLRGVADGKAQEILPFIRRTAAELLEKGLDTGALEAAMCRLEFQVLEPAEPAGLDRCINCMSSWLHGGDPMQYLVYRESFAEVRAMIENGGFEALMRDLYLDENGVSELTLIPSHTRGAAQRQEEAERLAAIAAGWKDADREANRILNEKLLNWQRTPDTPEQLATLPVLPLSAVSAEPPWTPTELHEENGITVLWHPSPSRGIIHATLYFSLGDLRLEDYQPLSLAQGMLGKLPTAHYTALELQQEMKRVFGSFSTSMVYIAGKNGDRTVRPYQYVRFSVLEDKLEAAQKLALEIMQTSDFSQKEKIREMLVQLDDDMKQYAVTSGHALAITMTQAHYGAAGAIQAAVMGVGAIKRLRGMVKDFDAGCAEICAAANLMMKQVFSRARLTASVAAPEYHDLSAMFAALPEGEAVPAAADYHLDLPERMGYQIPAQIGYAAQCWHLAEAGVPYHGSMAVASNLVSLSWLWNTVRVQGGAYGTGLRIGSEGAMLSYSYRDPSPAGALKANAGISGFLRSFCASDEPLEKFIISTVSGTEPLRTPKEEAFEADGLWLRGNTREEAVQRRAEMLGTTKESLLALCDLFDRYAEKGAVCVCGSAEQIAAVGGLEIVN